MPLAANVLADGLLKGAKLALDQLLVETELDQCLLSSTEPRDDESLRRPLCRPLKDVAKGELPNMTSSAFKRK